MSSPGDRNQIAQRQRTPEAIELLRAFRHAYTQSKRWHLVRLGGTVALALAAPLVIVFAPGLEHPLGAAASAWLLVTRWAIRPAEDRTLRFAVAVQELFDQYVLGLMPTTGPRPPAHEEIYRKAKQCSGNPDPDWYTVDPRVDPAAATLIAQRSSAVWTRLLNREWGNLLAVLVAGWTALTVGVAVLRGTSVGDFLIAVILPMLPALLDATDLCQAHWRATAERADLEAALDQRIDQATTGELPTQHELRALQDEIDRQRASQPAVPDWFYALRRAAYEDSMRAAAETLAKRLDALQAATAAPPTPE